MKSRARVRCLVFFDSRCSLSYRIVLAEDAVVGEDSVQVLLHESQHLAVGLGHHRRLAVDVEENAERTEVISRRHLTRHVLAVSTQPLYTDHATTRVAEGRISSVMPLVCHVQNV